MYGHRQGRPERLSENLCHLLQDIHPVIFCEISDRIGAVPIENMAAVEFIK